MAPQCGRTPVRPAAKYDLGTLFSSTYELNTRLIRRTLEHEHGISFVRHLTFDDYDEPLKSEHKEFERCDPYIEALPPFTPEGAPLLDDDEHDFPSLPDESLPTLTE